MVANVYIDGFNLYKGCISGTPFKWLNPRALAEQLLRGQKIDVVNYFTARVIDRPEDPRQSQRQDTYLDALATVERVKIHYGHFRTRKKRVWLVQPQQNGGHFATAKVTEEKATDVKLASRIVWDACHGYMDSALVISNDSDFQESIDLAMSKGVAVILVNPHHHAGQEDHLVGTDLRRLRRVHLERSQLPEEIALANGAVIRRPPEWGP